MLKFRFWYTINRACWPMSHRLTSLGFRLPPQYRRTREVVLALSDAFWALGHMALRKGAGLS